MAFLIYRGDATHFAFGSGRTADQQGLPGQLALFKTIAIILATNPILHTAQSQLEQAPVQYAQSGPSLLPQLELDSCQGYLTIKKRARLNTISYFLSLAPCGDQIPRKTVNLPKRSNEIATLGRGGGQVHRQSRRLRG